MSVERVLRKDGAVVWRVRWRQGGRNRSKVLGRKRDAEAFDAEITRRRRTGDLAQLDAGKEPLAQFGEKWWRLYAEPNLSRSTLKGYASIWDAHVLPRLGSVPLRELTPDVVNRFRLVLEADGVGPASVRKSLVLLQGVLQRACEWGRLASNPVAIVRKPVPPRARSVVPLAPERVETIRFAVLGCGRIRDATLISVLAYAGLRPGEALALRWSHVRERTLLVEGAVSLGTIERTKTGRSRTVRVLGPLAQDLAEWRLHAGRPPVDALLFPGHDGEPWAATAYRNWGRRIYAPAARAAGVERPRPYDLRHSFVSLLIAEGHSIVEVARQAGHSPTMARHVRARIRGVRSGRPRQRRRSNPRGARGAPLPCAAAKPLRRGVNAALDTYAELLLAEGKLLRWGEREAKGTACALQPRDLEILVALARYRFLTTGQIAELWWEGRGLRAVRRRMTCLFEAGFVERFRPQTLRGSYQWTYCLARDGFRAAQQTGELAASLKFAPRREAIYDYRYVIHDLRTNEWVLRYRELLGDRLLDWAGPDESRFEPPRKNRDEEYMSRATAVMGGCGWHVNDVADDYFRPVQPDALLDVSAVDQDVRVFVEYDRTRRVDKNYDKFLRYEALLVVWWRATDLGCRYVVFVCQDAEHRRRFVLAADNELTGHLFAHTQNGPEERYTARDRTLFVLESDIRSREVTAMLPPALPPRHEQRSNPASVRRVALPGLEG